MLPDLFLVKRCMEHDAVQPGREPGSRSERMQRVVHTHERILRRFFGIFPVQQNIIGKHDRHILVPVDQESICLCIA